MALVERLMHDSSEPENRFISVHTFFAACSEVERGALTQNQVQVFLDMTAPDIVDWNAMVALVTGTATNRLAVIQRLHAVFLLAEHRIPGYDTPTNVRTKLGI